jgi:hypothetical protein
LGRRSRKRRDPAAPAGEPVSRGYARGRERDEAARASLEPLAPGERPRAVTVAAVVALVIAVANLVGFLAGWEIDGEQPSALGFATFELLMLAAAWGLWQGRYWAVLGFEALLGITLVIAGLGLLVASNWQAVALSIGLLVTAGPLFWFLIRAMARIQMPRWPGPQSD